MRARVALRGAALMLAGLSSFACTDSSENSGGPTPNGPGPQVSSGGPLATAEVEDVAFLQSLDTIERSEDGLTLMQYQAAGGQSAFRIYDEDWTPVTPLLSMNVELDMTGSTPAGFIGYAMRFNRKARTTYRHWVVIETDGSVREVTRQPRLGAPRVRVRSSDVLLPDNLAYRPSQHRLFLRPQPAWQRSRWDLPFPGPNGSMCGRPPMHTRPIATSIDLGRTWTFVPTSSVPTGTGRDLMWCQVTRDRLVIQTGSGGWPRWLHTLDRATGRVLSSHRVGNAIDAFGNPAVLPDGVLAVGSRRRGLMVGTDSTNRNLDFRPGPIGRWTFSWLFGAELVAVQRSFLTVDVTEDAGRTWRRIDLAMPSGK